MKRIGWMKMMFFLALCVNAQNPYLDSLWREFRNLKNHDSLRLNALFEISWELKNNYPDSAFKLATDVEKSATHYNLPSIRSRAYNTKAVIYALRGDYNLRFAKRIVTF
jgi:hypothetical protein